MHLYAQKILMIDNDTNRKEKVIGGENIWSNLCPLSND